MRIAKFKRFTFIIFFLLFFSGCNTPESKEGDSIVSNRMAEKESADIYCFCLMIIDSTSGSNKYVSSCSSQSFSYYKGIIKSHANFLHVENRDTLNRLRNLIYNGDVVKNDYPHLGELNFAIIFRKNNNLADSFSFKPRNMNSLSINKDSAINYRFNILDSIAKILGKKNMECLSARGLR